MQYVRSGLILFCTKYEECRDFYRDVLELKILFAIEDTDEPLCCFDLGGSYLMVELLKDAQVSKNKLRLHVEDIAATEELLHQKDVSFTKNESEWGTVLVFKDPEGHIVSIRDEETFANQITA